MDGVWLSLPKPKALLHELEAELLAYSPEELVRIANEQFPAMEYVKTKSVPGRADAAGGGAAREGANFVREHQCNYVVGALQLFELRREAVLQQGKMTTRPATRSQAAECSTSESPAPNQLPFLALLCFCLTNNHSSAVILSTLGEESAAMVASHVNLAWMKLNEYYNKLWPVAYIGAVVLHPCFGWPALKYHWEGHAAARRWEEDYSARLAKLWKEEYTDHEFPGLAVNQKVSGRKMVSGYDAFFAQSLGKRKRVGSDDRAGNASAPVDEYERYLHNFAPADDKYQFNPLSWWRENEMQYPNLARMATDLLSIPTMSAETERSFSGAGKMVSPLRTRLDQHSIGMAQSLRSWSREGIVLPSW
ncbi:putative AC transposase [Purpureocillium lavendulum]|uniref:AC transposase n=1 Tax=Purpureocillium lavendulum TaxID=1247861 RepID=A0AB34FBP1_9HYPO|nr:putative AC transposase [Purpureocillium lavendulum]